jgi:hypothetical protein
MYLAPACALWLLLGSVVYEVPQILRGEQLVLWQHPGLVLGAAW